jgi:integrase
MTPKERQKTWEKTRQQNLVRHKSGHYYARAFAGGKEVWKSLKTDRFSVAQAKLAEFLRQHRALNGSGAISNRTGVLTFGEALREHLDGLSDAVKAKQMKPATEHYWKQVFAALLKSWSALKAKDVRRITIRDCQEWAKGFAKASSPTRFNNTIAGLRLVLDRAVGEAIIYSNPASTLKRMKVRDKELTLPTAEHFTKLVELVRSAGGWCSRACGDFVEGLAVTGMRKRDANELEWRDLDFKAGEVVVRGDPETGTKNWKVYRVPMIPAAVALFRRMRSDRPDESPTDKVFEVREAQKAINSACKKLKISRITHHDLRHLFATVCIESGVDIPTVSRWLNHKDGGALAMKTYGHLRREHSISQAKRVNFNQITPENVVSMKDAAAI